MSKSLTKSESRVLAYLRKLNHAFEGKVNVSIDKIATKCDVSEKTVDRSLKKLEESELIKRIGRVGKDGKRTTNSYIIFGHKNHAKPRDKTKGHFKGSNVPANIYHRYIGGDSTPLSWLDIEYKQYKTLKQQNALLTEHLEKPEMIPFSRLVNWLHSEFHYDVPAELINQENTDQSKQDWPPIKIGVEIFGNFYPKPNQEMMAN
jgi:DNA-binding transcriptional ArsR family regulator